MLDLVVIEIPQFSEPTPDREVVLNKIDKRFSGFVETFSDSQRDHGKKHTGRKLSSEGVKRCFLPKCNSERSLINSCENKYAWMDVTPRENNITPTFHRDYYIQDIIRTSIILIIYELSRLRPDFFEHVTKLFTIVYHY